MRFIWSPLQLWCARTRMPRQNLWSKIRFIINQFLLGPQEESQPLQSRQASLLTRVTKIENISLYVQRRAQQNLPLKDLKSSLVISLLKFLRVKIILYPLLVAFLNNLVLAFLTSLLTLMTKAKTKMLRVKSWGTSFYLAKWDLDPSLEPIFSPIEPESETYSSPSKTTFIRYSQPQIILVLSQIWCVLCQMTDSTWCSTRKDLRQIFHS